MKTNAPTTRAFHWLNVAFPLTPALSLRERERHSPRSLRAERVRVPDGLATVLPRPEGEGRGEGETPDRWIIRVHFRRAF